MKKIFLLLTVFSLVFASCDPLGDINDEIDAEANNAIVGSVDYTLVSDDYDGLGLEKSYFNDLATAKTMIPNFLADKYPVWGDKSSVLVGYELKAGTDIEEVANFTTAGRYTLANADYPDAINNAIGFYENENPKDFIPAILANSIASPTEGQIIRTKHKQYVGTTVLGTASFVEYAFAGSLEGWAITDVVGAQGWTSESGYVQGNGYAGGRHANEDWLISPEIDLAAVTSAKFQINQAIKYASDFSLLKILVSKNYTGDQTTATWDEITLATGPNAGNSAMTLSEDYDFSAYDGETIHIAFKYESTATDAGRWRIESLKLKAPGVEGTTVTREAFYMYSSGNWDLVDKAFYLNAEDYDSMGESSGQPGRYNNFSSSTPPNNYIPTFLSSKFPFAQEEDNIFIYYKYYESGTSVKGNKFTFTNGMWTPHQTKLQFGYEVNKWVPDNTIKHTLTRGANSDYDYLASVLTGTEYAGLIGNLSNYDDFDYNWSEDQILYSLGLLADHINPSAAEGQKYLFSYIVYDSGEQERSKWIKKEGGNWVLK